MVPQKCSLIRSRLSRSHAMLLAPHEHCVTPARAAAKETIKALPWIVQFDTALTQSPTQSQIIRSLPGHETPHVTSK